MASIHNEAAPAVWGNCSIISSLADPMEMLLWNDPIEMYHEEDSTLSDRHLSAQ